MRVLIPTIGSRGDVQPFIALAQGLNQANHRAILLSHPVMQPLVEAHGVTFGPMGPDVDLAQEAAIIRHRSATMITALQRVMTLAFDILAQAHEDILAAGRQADLVIVPASSAAGKNEAELLGLPAASVDFMPWTIPINDPSRSWFRRAAYAAINRLITPLTTRPLNKLRRRQGLPPVGPEGFRSSHLNLVPISPQVYAADPCWAPLHHLVGYWFVIDPPDWRPPAELAAFLAAGPPPLVISLGAMSIGGADDGTASLFLEVIHDLGQRTIIQGWAKIMKCSTLPETIFSAGSLPHNWLLPQAAALIHHGGFGTTAAALRAGIPQLVIPHLADQFYWGRRVRQLGVGPPPISRSKLTGDKLAAALVTLIDNPDQQATAARLGRDLRAESGVGSAVRLIERTFAGV